MAVVTPPPSYVETVAPKSSMIDSTWTPQDETVVDTDCVPAWPTVRPFFGPDGKTVLTWLSKFEERVFFNGGYSAGKGSEACAVAKDCAVWKARNGVSIDATAQLILANETNPCIGKDSSDWLFKTDVSKIKKLPTDAACTHGLDPTIPMFRGTWMVFELAPAFLRYCFPPLRQFWDGIMLKSHLGQMDFFPKLDLVANNQTVKSVLSSSVTAAFSGNETVQRTNTGHFDIGGHIIRTCVVDGVKMASVVDYVMLVRGLDRNDAAKYVSRFVIDQSDQYPKMGYCSFRKGGKPSPGMAATDLVKLTFKIASGARVATDIVNKWAAGIARLEGGDTTLNAEIEENATRAEAEPNGPNAFMRDSLTGEQLTRKRELDSDDRQDQPPSKVQAVLEYDAGYWIGQGMKPSDAIDMWAKAVAVYDQQTTVYERRCLAQATTPEVLVERERGLNIDKQTEQSKVLHAHRLEEMDRAHEHAMKTQQLVKKLDARYYIVRDLNRVQTDAAKTGPCLYFVDSLDTTIMFGHTGARAGMPGRYRREKNFRSVVANTLLALPAADKTQATSMEAALKAVLSDIPGMRIGRYEAVVNNWDMFATAMEKWNVLAETEGWPIVALP